MRQVLVVILIEPGRALDALRLGFSGVVAFTEVIQDGHQICRGIQVTMVRSGYLQLKGFVGHVGSSVVGVLIWRRRWCPAGVIS